MSAHRKDRNAAGEGQKPSLSPFVYLAVLMPLLLLTKIPSLTRAGLETDEEIYLQLAKNLAETGRYSLQGTPILNRLSKNIYDKPMFHHPPLFVFLILPLARSSHPQSAVIVSWFGHVMVLIAIVMLFPGAAPKKNDLLLVLVLLGAVFDPLLQFTSQKIWLEAPLAGFTSLSLAFFIKALEAGDVKGKKRYLIFSGILFGAAVLTKIPALLVGPVFLLAFLTAGGKKELRRWKLYGLCFLAPALLLTMPWFIRFYAQYKMLFPDWIAPDAWMKSAHPFIATVINRPFTYFFKETLFLYPLLLFPVGHLLAFGKKVRPAARLHWFWFLGILCSFTLMAVFLHHTYQMRFLTTAVAPLYLLLASSLEDLDIFHRPFLFMIALAALIPNFITTFVYIINTKFADIVSIYEIFFQGIARR